MPAKMRNYSKLITITMNNLMKEKLAVKVNANSNTGEIWTLRQITDSQTGEERTVGVIMLSQASFNSSGIGGLSKKTAFKTYEQEVIDLLGDLTDGQTFPIEGKLIVEETLVPYTRKDGSTQEPKRKGKDGEIITYHGSPVYRNTDFTTDMSAQDVLLRESKAQVPAPANQDENSAPY
jgi:hypothetical protein